MNSEDATSPSVGGPSKEDTTSEEVNKPTTARAEPLLLSLTREFDAVKELIKENRKTRLQALTSNPAVLVILTFVFTTAGTNLTSSLAIYQQQRAAERSFIDESNKLRIQKIGDVWEQLDQDEHTIDRLLEANNDIVAKFPTPNDRAKEIETIIASDRATVSKSRFWLGKEISEKINNYLNANIRYSIKKLAGTSEADLKADKAARDAAKSDVDQIREELLRRVPQSRN